MPRLFCGFAHFSNQTHTRFHVKSIIYRLHFLKTELNDGLCVVCVWSCGCGCGKCDDWWDDYCREKRRDVWLIFCMMFFTSHYLTITHSHTPLGRWCTDQHRTKKNINQRRKHTHSNMLPSRKPTTTSDRNNHALLKHTVLLTQLILRSLKANTLRQPQKIIQPNSHTAKSNKNTKHSTNSADLYSIRINIYSIQLITHELG